jgi:serine/threonine protein kinase
VVTTIRARGERRFKPKHETEAEWQKEARFLLSLRHPNIIQIYDMFEHLGTTTDPPPPDQVAMCACTDALFIAAYAALAAPALLILCAVCGRVRPCVVYGVCVASWCVLLGLYYLIVEECHGSLRQLVEQTGALPVNDVIAIAGQMLSGAPYHPPQRHSCSCSCWLTSLIVSGQACTTSTPTRYVPPHATRARRPLRGERR